MSTRCVVAKELIDEDTRQTKWVGRYVHSEGYPSAKIPDLNAIVEAKGLLRSIQILIDFHAGWSYLDPAATKGQFLDGRAFGVTGYGVAYSTAKMKFMGDPDYQQASWDNWETQDNADSWTEYAYVLTEQGIQVWVPVDNVWTFVKVQAWGDLDTDTLDAAIERL